MKQSKDAIRTWMLDYLARLLEIPVAEVDTQTSFSDYGLDSTAAAGLSGDLADWLGVHLQASMLKDHRTIDAVVNFVAKQAL